MKKRAAGINNNLREFAGQKETVRIDGKLREIITVRDEKGRIVHKALSPLGVEFHLQDVVQVIIGSSVLAVPVGFTEETWKLAETIPLISIFGFLIMSLTFISVFTYYIYHHNKYKLEVPRPGFIKRVIATYVLAFLVVAIILSLIEMAPWRTDLLLALKRVIIVTFPASMSGAIADLLR